MVNHFSAILNYLVNSKILKVVECDKYHDKSVREFPTEISRAV